LNEHVWQLNEHVWQLNEHVWQLNEHGRLGGVLHCKVKELCVQ